MAEDSSISKIITLRDLLSDHTNSNADYVEFNEETTDEEKKNCYKAVFDFFLLKPVVFVIQSDICQTLSNLFRRPTVKLRDTSAYYISSYVVLEFTLFCIHEIKSIYTSKKSQDEKENIFESIVSGLDGFDNGYAFYTATPRQLVYYTEDTSEKCKLITHLLSLCISIQCLLDEVGIKKQLTTFACNRIVSLYIERIKDPQNPVRSYTSDFNPDIDWLSHVLLRTDATIKTRKLSSLICKEDLYMRKLLNSILIIRPVLKHGGGKYRTLSRKSVRRTRRRTTRRRR